MRAGGVGFGLVELLFGFMGLVILGMFVLYVVLPVCLVILIAWAIRRAITRKRAREAAFRGISSDELSGALRAF